MFSGLLEAMTNRDSPWNREFSPTSVWGYYWARDTPATAPGVLESVAESPSEGVLWTPISVFWPWSSSKKVFWNLLFTQFFRIYFSFSCLYLSSVHYLGYCVVRDRHELHLFWYLCSNNDVYNSKPISLINLMFLMWSELLPSHMYILFFSSPHFSFSVINVIWKMLSVWCPILIWRKIHFCCWPIFTNWQQRKKHKIF